MSNSQDNFLFRLADMLSRQQSSISVALQLEAVQLRDQQEFLKKLLPRYFKHKNIGLFKRQMVRQGIKLVDRYGDMQKHQKFPNCDWSSGIARLKQAIQQVKQLKQVQKLTHKIQKTLMEVEREADGKDLDCLTEHLYQLKRLNKDYSLFVDNFGSSLTCQTSLTCSAKQSSSQIDIMQPSDWHIPLPELRHTEHLIISPL